MAQSRRIAGITIEIDGNATKLNNALKDVDKQLSNTQSELRDVNKLLKLDPKNTDLVVQKHRLLGEAVKDTKDRLTQLKEAQKGATDTAGYDTLQREIIETEKNLESLQAQYDKLGGEGASDAAVRLQAKLNNIGDTCKEVGEKMSNIGSKMTSMFTLPIVAGFTAAAKSASDYEENVNKIEVAFGDSADEVKKWADTAKQQFGLSKVQATSAASAFGALAKGIGLGSGAAADMATELSGLSADLGSYFNMSVDDSARALEGIFTGEAEALKKFGVVMSQTNLEKFAADNGKVYKEMSEAEKVQLRYNYVLSQTKDAQGDYARTSSGTANSIKTFTATLQDLATTIGQKLLPIITPMIQKITEWVDKFSNLSPSTQELIVKLGLLIAAAGPLLGFVGKITSGVGSIMKAGSGLVGLVSGGGGLIASLGGIVTAVGPLLAGGAIVAGIVAGVVLIVKNWKTIKKWAGDLGKAFKDMGKRIGDSVKQAKDTVVRGFTNIKNGMATAWNSIRDNTSKAWSGIKNTIGNTWNSIKTTASRAWTGTRTSIVNVVTGMASTITAKLNSFKTGVSNIWTNIRTTSSHAWSNIKTTVVGIAQQMPQGMQGAMSAVRNSVINAFKDMGSLIKSPMENAWNTVTGFLSRIRDAFGNLRLSIPKIKMPHISVKWHKIGTGSFALQIPHLSIQWYKKAYENAVMFSKPTVLQTPFGAKGFGDGNGSELVLSDKKLRQIAGAAGDINATFNIYASDNMNINTLADKIQDRLAALQRQKEMSFT